MQRVGFIGIGLWQEMSRRILEAGYPLTVWNRTQERADFLLKQGSMADSPRAVAQAADVVITMVTDSALPRKLSAERGQSFKEFIPDSSWHMGSIAPEMSRLIADGQEPRVFPCWMRRDWQSKVAAEGNWEYGRRSAGNL